MQKENKTCQNCKNEFTIEADDFGFYEKIKVPPPTWCPECRFLRRAVFRNERKLFRNKNAVTGESVISLYPPESGYLIYNDTYWTGDSWNPLSYGQEFDRSRPFLAQVQEINQKIPHPRVNALNMTRSDYSANASDMKDCYLVFNSADSQDCAYGNGVDSSSHCFDTSHVKYSEKCYESFWLTKCYETFFSAECDNCVSVWFSKNCHGCTNCFGCVNLVGKSYYFFNEPFSKEEYLEKIKSLNLNKFSEIEKTYVRAKAFWKKFPVKYFSGMKNVSSLGEYIINTKNVRDGFLIREAEDLAYAQFCQHPPFKDAMDVTVSGKSELMYECCVCGWEGSHMKFAWECWDGGMDIEYSMFSGRNAKNIFGCVAVSSGEYLILNKRYSKEEYFKLKDEIIKHMNEMPYVDTQGRVYKYGEFFPPEFSPFSYNDTIAADFKVMTKDEAIAFGSKWYETLKKDFETTTSAKDLPDSIYETDKSILKEIIGCLKCGKAYRIINSEFDFLKKHSIPLPRFCVDCRHMTRISQRNKNVFYDRTCMCKNSKHGHGESCLSPFRTSFPPDGQDTVYCEKCYQQEVY